MAQKLSNLANKSKVKFGSLYGSPIVWIVADKNHAGYPSNSVTLVTNQIIKMLCFDAAEPSNGNSGRRGYGNINLYAGCFQQFVASHRPLWFLFYNFHLNLKDYRLSVSYRRRLVRLSQLFEPDLAAMFPRLGRRRLKMSQKVLETGLTALSALSSDGRGDKRSELLLNTYLAGMMMLNRE